MPLGMIDNTMIRDNFIMIDSISKAEPLARKIHCLAKPLLFRSSSFWDYGGKGKSILVGAQVCWVSQDCSCQQDKTEATWRVALGLGMSTGIEPQNGWGWKGPEDHLIPTPLPWQGDVCKRVFIL